MDELSIQKTQASGPPYEGELPKIAVATFVSENPRNWHIAFCGIHEYGLEISWCSEYIADCTNEMDYEECKWAWTCGMTYPDDDSGDSDEDIHVSGTLICHDTAQDESGKLTNYWQLSVLSPSQEGFWLQLAGHTNIHWGMGSMAMLDMVCDWAREQPKLAKNMMAQLPVTVAMEADSLKAIVQKVSRAIRQGLVA